MKKIVAVLVLLLGINTFAEVSLGVDLGVMYNNDHRDDNQDPATVSDENDFNFSLHPALIIAPNDRIELVPFVGFYVNHQWGETRNGDDITSKYSHTDTSGFDFGMGLFFRLVNREIIRFSLGPQLTFRFDLNNRNFARFNMEISDPVNIDFLFTEHFFVRMSSSIASLNVSIYDTDSDRSHSAFDTKLETVLWPSLGFYFTL